MTMRGRGVQLCSSVGSAAYAWRGVDVNRPTGLTLPEVRVLAGLDHVCCAHHSYSTVHRQTDRHRHTDRQTDRQTAHTHTSPLPSILSPSYHLSPLNQAAVSCKEALASQKILGLSPQSGMHWIRHGVTDDAMQVWCDMTCEWRVCSRVCVCACVRECACLKCLD